MPEKVNTRWMFLEALDKKATCKKCGREFNVTPEWYWYYGAKIACSYRCMRAMERADPSSRLYREENGEPKPKEIKPFTPEEIEKVRKLQDQGNTFVEIGRILDRSPGSISTLVRRLNAQKRYLGLDKTKVETIRGLWKYGLTGYEIAKRTDVSPGTVYKYIKGVERLVEGKKDKRA